MSWTVRYGYSRYSLTRVCSHVMDCRSGAQGRCQDRQFRGVEAVGGHNGRADQVGEGCLHREIILKWVG